MAFLVYVSLIFSLCFIHYSFGALECERLGLCSVGKVRQVFQDISDANGLKIAVEGRAYKKELFTAVSSYQKVSQFLQLYWNLYHLGYEHILLISYNPKECEAILKHSPYLGVCTWDTLKIGSRLEGHFLLWHLRYRELARIVRLGYNAWALDTDIYFFHDPYTFLKSPPFTNMTIFHQAECVWDQSEWENSWNANGGFIYVQNAKPNGVAAWYLAEITYRPLRWLDDNWRWMSTQKIRDNCALLDQDTMEDIMPSILTGVPMFQHCLLTSCFPDSPMKRTIDGTLNGAREEGLRERGHVVDFTVPDSWVPVVGNKVMRSKFVEMKMPNVGRGKYPSKHGLNLYPPEKGPLSNAFMKLMEEDCPSCGFWPDASDPTQLAAAEKVPSENLMFFPPWFVLGWWARARYGHWDTQPPQQVVGHMNYNPAAYGKYHKLIGVMGMGKWNWSISHAVYGDLVFLANQHEHHLRTIKLLEGLPQAAPASSPPLRLVGFAPSVDLTRTRDSRDLQELLKGLVQVALLTGRTVIWPDVPCSRTPWMVLEKDGDTVVPLHMVAAFFQYGGPLGNQSCMWWGYATETCSSHFKGIMMPEFAEYQRMYANQFKTTATKDNTVLTWPASGPAHGPRLLDDIVEVEAQALQVALTSEKWVEQQVLYIGHPVLAAHLKKVSSAFHRYVNMIQQCPVLKHEYIANGAKLDLAVFTPKKGKVDAETRIQLL